jgi:hypothetical protein
MPRKIVTLCLLLLFMAPSAAPQEVSYRRITMKERVKAFYRTGGKAYLGKKVHILVPARVFKKHSVVLGRNRKRILRFENRSVPLLVQPANPYYKRMKREMKKKRIETVSVFGKIIRPSWDPKGKCHLLITKVKTCNGALRKTGG